MPDLPFSQHPNESIHTDMGWLSRQGLSHLGFAYREAADVLCDAPAAHGSSEEAMYLVASFAYRHSIELYLKAVISLLGHHSGVPVPQQLQRRHQLLPMWDWINERLADLGHPPLAEDDRDVVAEFQRVDHNGTAFRYNLDLHGNAQLEKLPPLVSLGSLKKSASSIIHMLDSLDEYFSETTINEA